MNSETKRWLAQAEHDLENAEKNYRAEMWDVSAFLAQQAAEKALKALIFDQTGSPPPRIHSIQRLTDIAGVRQDLAKEIVQLDDVYVASRYPEAAGPFLPYEIIDEDKTVATLNLAREVFSLVTRRIRDG